MTPEPPRRASLDPRRLLATLTGLLVCTVLAGIVRNYPRYMPPDFTSDVLLGRADSFHGVYPWAFYAHIAAGPVTLLLGLALMSGTLRRWWPAWHRLLGRIQVLVVLVVLAPSGLWMSASAATGATGAIAGLGFGTLAGFDADWLYPASAWASWLVQLAACMAWQRATAVSSRCPASAPTR